LSPLDFARLVDRLLPAVLEAARVQMRYYTAGIAVGRKADASPVTAADQDSEAILLAALAEAAPGVPVVAEEAVSAGRIPALGDRFFLVDPLDGTREFIDRRDEFTINIAMVEAGRPVWGVVYAPALATLYATRGSTDAVMVNVSPESRAAGLAALAPRRIQVRRADPKRLVALASRSHLTPETSQWLERHNVASMVQAGSSLKFCVIARGEADVYPRFGPTCEWDTAAGEAVLRAAGGQVLLPVGGPMTYGKAGARFLNPSFIAWGQRAECG
jgi:3'(2'), 5'-bisphosphate nucleotidase